MGTWRPMDYHSPAMTRSFVLTMAPLSNFRLEKSIAGAGGVPSDDLTRSRRMTGLSEWLVPSLSVVIVFRRMKRKKKEKGKKRKRRNLAWSIVSRGKYCWNLMYLEIVTAARSTLYAYRNTLHISLVKTLSTSRGIFYHNKLSACHELFTWTQVFS